MSDIRVKSRWIDRSNSDVVVVTDLLNDLVLFDYCNNSSKKSGSRSKSDFIKQFKLLNAAPVPQADMVNHPPHYKDESGVECCQVTDLMMFNAASCFKYLYRCGNKWDDIEDLKKAVWYAKRSYLTGDNEQPNSLEWDNNIKAIASYREHGIYRAMTAIRSYSWLAVAAFIGDEIARLESEQQSNQGAGHE